MTSTKASLFITRIGAWVEYLGWLRSFAALAAAILVCGGGLGVLTGLIFEAAASWRAAWIGLAGAMAALPPLAWALRLFAELHRLHQQQLSTEAGFATTTPAGKMQFLDLAEREWARCRRYGDAAALLLVACDHYSAHVDAHGAEAGVALLDHVARLAGATLRQPDLLAHFGGDEFVAFLPSTDPLGAVDAAERIRERVADKLLVWRGVELRTTVSVGVAPVDKGQESLDSLIHDADVALLAAKQAGRNCVRSAPTPPSRRGAARDLSAPR